MTSVVEVRDTKISRAVMASRDRRVTLGKNMLATLANVASFCQACIIGSERSNRYA
jgi:hypothetical protein